jgi:Alpha amylase, catalytic domain
MTDGPGPRFPAVYEINTRAWLTDHSRALGRPATLDDISNDELDDLARRGFDWVWLLSVWTTGPASREVSRTNPEWRREFEATLPDLTTDDIGGSGFALTGFRVSPALGGEAALARIRARLAERGLRLMLDFVPNHTALDHPWVEDQVDRYVRGSELDLVRSPANYTWVRRSAGEVVLAYGRDPYFPGWPDTLQLDYADSTTGPAMAAELDSIAERCDGVRCDMAMLILPEVFDQTWGRPALPFWPDVIETVKRRHPGFTFMAEVYWDLEWTLMEQGFDFAYDKRLYDRLRSGDAGSVRGHLQAGPEFQVRLARFLENHDEPRAAGVFPPSRHAAAAVIAYLTPGLRLFHQGQLEGRRVRLSPHLVRAPEEPIDAQVEALYDRLLGVVRDPIVHAGTWQLLDCRPAWEGNPSWDGFVAWAWTDDGGRCLLVAVNFSPEQGQCFVRFPLGAVAGRAVRLEDRTSDQAYQRNGDDLLERGLYLDLAGWGYNVFEVLAGPAATLAG